MWGLTNSWAPISGLVWPSAASRATWMSRGVSASGAGAARLRTGLAGGQQLAAGPLPEGAKVAGLVAFYNEKADIIVEGRAAGAPVDAVLVASPAR